MFRRGKPVFTKRIRLKHLFFNQQLTASKEGRGSRSDSKRAARYTSRPASCPRHYTCTCSASQHHGALCIPSATQRKLKFLVYYKPFIQQDSRIELKLQKKKQKKTKKKTVSKQKNKRRQRSSSPRTGQSHSHKHRYLK